MPACGCCPMVGRVARPALRSCVVAFLCFLRFFFLSIGNQRKRLSGCCSPGSFLVLLLCFLGCLSRWLFVSPWLLMMCRFLVSYEFFLGFLFGGWYFFFFVGFSLCWILAMCRRVWIGWETSAKRKP